MKESQTRAVVRLLEMIVHSQMHNAYVAHSEKVEMLDGLHDVKREFGCNEEIDVDPFTEKQNED